mmetsp:Transcript_12553/g.17830  ORF Transcript_12553/g.17830 Transcript_12553/m.17830 type:complete len:124 (-) Transcript_12553:177-548(-)
MTRMNPTKEAQKCVPTDGKAYNTFRIAMVSSLKDSEGQAQPLQHSTHATNKGPALQLGLCESARRVGRRLQNAASYVSGGTKCHIYMPGCLDSPSMNRTRGEIGPGGHARKCNIFLCAHLSYY